MRSRAFVCAAAVAAAIVIVPAAGRAAPCAGYLAPAEPAPRKLRFGVTAAGLVFPSQPAPPEDPVRNMEAFDQLSGGEPFVVRLNRFLYSQGAAGVERFDALARTYTDAGYLVSLQLRYGRLPAGGTPAGFASWVRHVVAVLGANPGVVSLEVTNEPNLGSAPDNSDGAFAGVRDALVQGVIAAKEEIRARGFDQLEVGFNWFHDTGPVAEDAFWSALNDPSFAADLDWVGLNAYPGTYGFVLVPPTFEDEDMVVALGKLRRCYLPMIGVPQTTPIRVIENGWPNGMGRTHGLQSEALERMLGVVHRHAETFNVTDYLWFTLRDSRTGAIPNERNYGLLEDDYESKPVFETYRRLIAELG